MGASSCGACGETVAGADSWLDRQGKLVCRRCFYADQTKLQVERVNEAEQGIGPLDAFALGKRVLVGGMLILVGGSGLVGSLRSGAWRDAMWLALLTLVGTAVVTMAIRAARPRRY